MSYPRDLIAADYRALWRRTTSPASKIDGRYYANPSTDKQKIDVNGRPFSLFSQRKGEGARKIFAWNLTMIEN